jgi:mRNA interferase MazF
MFKTFEEWFRLKLKIHQKVLPNDFHINLGELWWCYLGENIGVEADGKGASFLRPVLIVRVFNRQHLWVAPVTKQAAKNIFHFSIPSFSQDSVVMCSQLRTVSSLRLFRYIGIVNNNDLDDVVQRLVHLLMNRTPACDGGSSRLPKEQ